MDADRRTTQKWQINSLVLLVISLLLCLNNYILSLKLQEHKQQIKIKDGIITTYKSMHKTKTTTEDKKAFKDDKPKVVKTKPVKVSKFRAGR